MPQKKKGKLSQFLIAIFVLAVPFLLLINSKESGVYLCMGPKSHSYHKTKNCTGLDRCSTVPIIVDLSDAIKKYKRDPCDFCYKPKK